MPASPSPQPLRNSLRQKKDGTPTKAKVANDKQTPLKGAAFGKAIGIDKPANVRDKIRKWQAELDGEDSGAENVVASPKNDDVEPALAPSPKLPSTPKAGPVEEGASPRPTHTPTKSIEAIPERPMSAKKPAHNKLDVDVQVATAPKKRVVSDSHWRNRKSPPKDGTTRPSPKPLPTAWVRPAARRAEPTDTKVSTPNKSGPRPMIIFTSKSTGQRNRSVRQRRLSRPSSSGNEGRPTSSGSGSAREEKADDDAPTSPVSPPASADKYELVRVRRRRRSGPSPRGSLSAEDATPVKRKSVRKSETLESEDLANQITVEYEPSRSEPHQDEDVREKRRRSRRKEHNHNSPDESPRDPMSTGRRRSHRRSYQNDVEEIKPSPPTDLPIPETPPRVFGSRLEAWLQTTPDPFIDSSSRTRRASKESISTLELNRQTEQSDVTSPSHLREAAIEDTPERKSSEKRRRRKRSVSIKVDTQDVDDKPSTIESSNLTESIAPSKDEEGTPTSALKRRGARRSQYSPTKDRIASSPIPTSTTKDDDIASSAPSSSVDPSTMELEKISLRPRAETMAMRRLFPSTGKRLSTIASVETFATKMKAAPPSEAIGSEAIETVAEPEKKIEGVTSSEVSDQFNAETITTISRRSTKRSRLASHADLMSVLSMPRAGTRSIMSARSIRTNRSRLATATIGDIMNELASDETKYMRELRTLVDGVIPVLLSCVLSKSDSAVAAGLFSRSSKVDPNNVTKPIIDMGISLERLKTLHRRIPKDSPDAFLSWAQSAQRVYSDYINAWRLGFEDVVVSLAPADEDPFTPAKVVHGPDDAAPWDEGLPRNAEGYVVNGDGERVDVAYMLKRPLVRLKYLAKSIRVIQYLDSCECKC